MIWLALVVGNSRFHWALFEEDILLQRWDTPHCDAAQLTELQNQGFAAEVWQRLDIPYPQELRIIKPNRPEVWLASVVESPAKSLALYPQLTLVERRHIPLADLYDTMGVDRALTLLGAGRIYGWPVLVVDCGTALTFTAGAKHASGNQGRFLGGAIAPGLGLQFRALHSYTDQLPQVNVQNISWPQRWAQNTQDAIASGVLYTHLAGIRDFLTDWLQHNPSGRVIFTGGDGKKMANYLKQHSPSLISPSLIERVQIDPDLMFWGLRAYRRGLTKDR